MQEAIDSRNGLIMELTKLEEKKSSVEEQVYKLHSGKKTLKNLFKTTQCMPSHYLSS